jgi:hypothetical protein
MEVSLVCVLSYHEWEREGSADYPLEVSNGSPFPLINKLNLLENFLLILELRYIRRVATKNMYPIFACFSVNCNKKMCVNITLFFGNQHLFLFY